MMDDRLDALVELVARQAETMRRQAAMLERQGEELNQIRLQMADLHQRSTSDQSPTGPADPPDDPAETSPSTEGRPAVEEPGMPRRRLMRLLGTGTAVGAAAVGTSVLTATPAAAAPNNPLIIGAANDAAATTTSVASAPTVASSSAFTVYDNSTNDPIGIYAVAGTTSTIAPDAGGVIGNSHVQPGVVGLSETNAGVVGASTSGDGLAG